MPSDSGVGGCSPHPITALGIYDPSETTAVDANPPGADNQQYQYFVIAVGSPGNPSYEKWMNRVCVKPNEYVRLEGAGSGPEAGWFVASAGVQRLLTSPSRFIGQVPSSREVIFYHTDHLGTPVVITNESGQVLSKHKYFPFGEEMSPQGGATHTRRFTGHERDSESGLDYMLARYYSAAQGRFLSVDPSSRGVDPRNPQTWNRYSYVLNNPLRLTDPDGLTYDDPEGKKRQAAVQQDPKRNSTEKGVVQEAGNATQSIKTETVPDAKIVITDKSGNTSSVVGSPEKVGAAGAAAEKNGSNVDVHAGEYNANKDSKTGQVVNAKVTIYSGSWEISKKGKAAGVSREKFNQDSFIHESAHVGGPRVRTEKQVTDMLGY